MHMTSCVSCNCHNRRGTDDDDDFDNDDCDNDRYNLCSLPHNPQFVSFDSIRM